MQSVYEALQNLDAAVNSEGMAYDKIVHAVFDIISNLDERDKKLNSVAIENIDSAMLTLYNQSLSEYMDEVRAPISFIVSEE